MLRRRSLQQSPNPTYRLHLLEDEAQLASWADRWRALEATGVGSAGVFHSYDWLRPFFHMRKRRPCVLAVEDVKGLVLIAPFSLVCRGGLEILEWLGEPLLAYGDLLVREGVDVAEALRSSLVLLRDRGKRFDVLHLRKVRRDAVIVPFLQQLATAPWQGGAPYADFDNFNSFEAFLGSRNKRSIKSYRRRRRRLEEEGEVHFKVHKAGPQAQKLGREAIELKIKWMKADGRVSRSLGSQECMHALIDCLGNPHTHACVSGLYLNDRPIAAEIGFVKRRHYYSLIGSIDTGYEKFSPGNLQILETMRWCYEQGIHVFDFLPPVSEYKNSWSSAVIEVGEFCLGYTLPGRLYKSLYVQTFFPMLVQAHARTPSIARALSILGLARPNYKAD